MVAIIAPNNHRPNTSINNRFPITLTQTAIASILTLSFTFPIPAKREKLIANNILNTTNPAA
jgi:hypothetical protein